MGKCIRCKRETFLKPLCGPCKNTVIDIISRDIGEYSMVSSSPFGLRAKLRLDDWEDWRYSIQEVIE